MNMLKPYKELVKIDVSPFCDKREALDDNKKKILVPYLNWAKCKELLHEHGAESVYFTPLKDASGSYVFCSKEVQNKDGRKTGCYFVSVEIHVDDKVFTMDTPLLNGSLMVYEDTLNQLRIANAQARAFVKGVAIHTGLGFSLWCGDSDTDAAPDDLSGHSIFAIKQRVEQLLTAKLQNGLSMDDALSALGINKKRFDLIMSAFSDINVLETKLRAL